MVMQMNLFELNNGINPAEKLLLHSINVRNKSIDDVAKELRLLIEIDLEKQRTCKFAS